VKRTIKNITSSPLPRKMFTRALPFLYHSTGLASGRDVQLNPDQNFPYGTAARWQKYCVWEGHKIVQQCYFGDQPEDQYSDHYFIRIHTGNLRWARHTNILTGIFQTSRKVGIVLFSALCRSFMKNNDLFVTHAVVITYFLNSIRSWMPWALAGPGSPSLLSMLPP